MKLSLTSSLFISLGDTGRSLIVLFNVFSTSFSDLRVAITVSSKVSDVLEMSLDNPSACPILFVNKIIIESENHSLEGWFPIEAVCWLCMLGVLF